MRVRLNSKLEKNSFFIIYWRTLSGLLITQAARCFLTPDRNSQVLQLHSHTSCWPCIMDAWFYLPPYLQLFTPQTSRQARTSACHLCTKAQCSIHSPGVPSYHRTLTAQCSAGQDRGRLSCQDRPHTSRSTCVHSLAQHASRAQRGQKNRTGHRSRTFTR